MKPSQQLNPKQVRKIFPAIHKSLHSTGTWSNERGPTPGAKQVGYWCAKSVLFWSVIQISSHIHSYTGIRTMRKREINGKDKCEHFPPPYETNNTSKKQTCSDNSPHPNHGSYHLPLMWFDISRDL